MIVRDCWVSPGEEGCSSGGILSAHIGDFGWLLKDRLCAFEANGPEWQNEFPRLLSMSRKDVQLDGTLLISDGPHQNITEVSSVLETTQNTSFRNC